MNNLTLPNLLTALRLLLILPILYALQKGSYIEATALTGLAFMTDYFDGRLARSLNCSTRLGSIMDPIADKLIILALMAFFAYDQKLSILYFCLSSTRDVSQLMAIPVLMSWKKINFQVKPKLPAKLATTLKYVILSLLLGKTLFESEIGLQLTPILFISAALEIYILLTFLTRFSKIYSGKHNTFE